MPIPSIDQFKALLRKSGAVAPEHLERALSSYTPATNEKDPTRALVRYLIARKLLTPWQSEQLLRGKSQLCLGPYRLLGRLGAGGMSTVFAAEHTVMRRPVAIKVLPKDHTNRPQALDRFLREAQVISSCNHPNVVQAYDVDNVQGVYFIVLERVEGRDLEKMVVVEGPLSANRAADYIRQAAEGLAHVHALGVVHRDVKPSNLLLDLTGTVKLLDLGVALLTLDESGSRTTKQTTLGTTEYMAPEQAMDSHAVDARADLYSLGCTLYYLLTGSPPFPARTMAEALLKHLKHAPKPISAFREEMGLPDVPDDLVAICDKLMAKKPQDRFQSADEVAAELSEWQSHRSSVSMSETWNAIGSTTPTESWPPRKPDAPAPTPRERWETDDTVESGLSAAAVAAATPSEATPPAVSDAEPEAVGSTLRHAGSSTTLQPRLGGSPTTGTPVIEEEPAEEDTADAAATEPVAAHASDEHPVHEPESHESALGDPAPSEMASTEVPGAVWTPPAPVAPAAVAAPAETSAPPARSSTSTKLLAVAGLAVVLLLTAGGLWASGLLSREPQKVEDRGGKPRPKKVVVPLDPEEFLSGPPRLVPGVAPHWRSVPGRVGRALEADGRTALVFESQPALEPAKLTLECWVRVQKFPTGPEPAYLVAKNADERSPGHYAIVLQGDKLAAVVNPTGAPEPTRVVAPNAIPRDSWRHAALTDDGQTLKFYVDGRLAGSTKLEAPRQTGDGPLAIATRPDRNTPPTADLHLDEVRLFRRTLSDDEIKLHAERPDWAIANNKSAGLITAWDFDPVKLENPSFERDWHSWSIQNGARPQHDKKRAHHGERFLLMPPGENHGDHTITGLTPDGRYTLVGWARTGSPKDCVWVGVKDYGGRERSVPVSSTEWAPAVIPFTVNHEGKALIYAYKNNGSEALFDDVKVIAGWLDEAQIGKSVKVAVGPALDPAALAGAPGVEPELQIDPARLALRVLCGKPESPDNVLRDGFSARREGGSDWAGWNADAPRTHCWSDPENFAFIVQTPPDVSGVLRLIFCDGDRQQRRQRVSVEGRDAGEVFDFAEPKQMTIAVDPAMTADGQIYVALFATGTGPAVVSDVEFYANP